MAEITKEQQEQLDNFNWTKYEQGIDQVDQNSNALLKKTSWIPKPMSL